MGVGMEFVRRSLRWGGYDLVRYDFRTHPAARRNRLLAHFAVSEIFDIGANVGQFALSVRRSGFKGRIVSCEPLTDAYLQLSRRAAGDPLWTTERCAIGESTGMVRINVAKNSQSSSLLPMLPRHVVAAPQAQYVGHEEVPVTTLSKFIQEHGQAGSRALVKLDVQGYELRILMSAREVLGSIAGLQLEMSLTQLYESEALLPEVLEFTKAEGFSLMALEPVFSDPTSGRLLQMDGLFFRESFSA